MIAVHAISPQNEMRVAERLRDLIESAWPGVSANPRDRVDILVGVRTPVDVDILVIVDLDKPRELPSQRRRLGGSSSSATVQTAIIAIEVKQLDADRFDRIGNQWFARYDGNREDRSVSVQVRESALGVLKFARQSGCTPFIFSAAWLTEVDNALLEEAEPIVLGRETTWFTILDCAMQQNATLGQPATQEMSVAARVVRERLLNRRKESNRDLVRFRRLSQSLASGSTVDGLLPLAGSAQIRLIGRGGSGKTTSLALLAVRLAEAGDRVLILTFHRTLRSDIAHLIDALKRPAGIPDSRIQVETTMSFLLSALTALGVPIPMTDNAPNYSALDELLDETRVLLKGTTEAADGDIAQLRLQHPERFAWDHVFIDEAQDCSDSERDFIRALYGHRRLVLADGVDQLVRRQIACDWNLGVPEAERITHRLDRSLRMFRNVATFANCFARAADFASWRITPSEDLPGGRIIIAIGDVVTPDVFRAIVRAAAKNRADAVDCLVCVPPKTGDDQRRSDVLAAALEAGIPVWDGTIAETRASANAGNDALRLVRYESCRGLEGWITLALDVDDFAKNKIKHPNLNPKDPDVAPEIVADRWMLIPLTRAVHTLILTLRDQNSRMAELLREATDDPAMPRGVVEWVDAAQLSAVLAPEGVVA